MEQTNNSSVKIIDNIEYVPRKEAAYRHYQSVNMINVLLIVLMGLPLVTMLSMATSFFIGGFVALGSAGFGAYLFKKNKAIKQEYETRYQFTPKMEL